MADCNKLIPLDYESPPRDDDEDIAPIRLNVPVIRRRTFSVLGVTLLISGVLNALHHQTDGFTEIIYGLLIAGLGILKFRNEKK